jgi:hypothetical protein
MEASSKRLQSTKRKSCKKTLIQNVVFSLLLQELYVTSTKRQKMAISRSIVDAVRSMNPPGRFLEKNMDTGLWNDIGNRKAIEKTSQALRDGAATLRKQLSADLGDPEFLSAVFDMEAATRKASPVASKEKETVVKVRCELYLECTGRGFIFSVATDTYIYIS